MQKIGTFEKHIIELLELDIVPGTPIFIGESNVSHIKSRHPYEFDKYLPDIEHIVKNPGLCWNKPKR